MMSLQICPVLDRKTRWFHERKTRIECTVWVREGSPAKAMGGTSGSKQRQRKHVKRLGWRVRGVLFACVYCLSHHLVFPLRPCLASHPGSSFLDYRLYITSHLCYTYALQIPQHFHLPQGVFIALI